MEGVKQVYGQYLYKKQLELIKRLETVANSKIMMYDKFMRYEEGGKQRIEVKSPQSSKIRIRSFKVIQKKPKVLNKLSNESFSPRIFTESNHEEIKSRLTRITSAFNLLNKEKQVLLKKKKNVGRSIEPLMSDRSGMSRQSELLSSLTKRPSPKLSKFDVSQLSDYLEKVKNKSRGIIVSSIKTKRQMCLNNSNRYYRRERLFTDS